MQMIIKINYSFEREREIEREKEKEREICKNIYNERLNKIEELTKKIRLEEAKNLQEDFNELLKKMLKGIKRAEQRKTSANINMLFNGRNDAIKFV